MARSVLAVFFFLFLLDISIEFNPQIRAFLGLFLVDTFTMQLTAFSLLVAAALATRLVRVLARVAARPMTFRPSFFPFL